MKIKTWIEWHDEVEVEIDDEQLVAAFSASIEPQTNWFHLLNRIAFALKALPAATIATWTPEQRAMIHSFLSDQTARFKGDHA